MKLLLKIIDDLTCAKGNKGKGVLDLSMFWPVKEGTMEKVRDVRGIFVLFCFCEFLFLLEMNTREVI